MNYFERLIRRAVVRPASAPGAALDDPFARASDWPLDAPAAKPGTIDDASPDTQRAIEPVPVTVLPAAEFPETPKEPPTPGPAKLPPHSPASSVLPEVGTGVGSAAVPPPIPLALPSESGVAPHEDALMLADAFMRSLGVQPQLPELAPAPVAAPPDVESKPVPIAAAKSGAVSPAQVIAPLASPPVLSSAPAFRAASQADAPPRAAAREQRRDSAAPPRTVIETRHVVLERTIGGGESAAVPGGGAPRFGLGQL